MKPGSGRLGHWPVRGDEPVTGADPNLDWIAATDRLAAGTASR